MNVDLRDDEFSQYILSAVAKSCYFVYTTEKNFVNQE